MEKNILAYKNKIHVGGKLILLCFSTLKLEFFVHLSLQTSVYDHVSDVKHYINTKIYFTVCHLKERERFVSFWTMTLGAWVRENSDK